MPLTKEGMSGGRKLNAATMNRAVWGATAAMLVTIVGAIDLVIPAVALSEDPSWSRICGVAAESSGTYSGAVGCGDDDSEYVVRFLFVTFPNVLDTLGVQEQVLPSYADSLVADLIDYIRFISVDTVNLDGRVEKRPGADSLYYWVTDEESNDICTAQYEVFDALPPQGWNDDVDLTVYCLADQLCDQTQFPHSYGKICSTPPQGYATPYILQWSGSIEDVEGVWIPISRPIFEATTVHELGHSFNIDNGHLPNGSTGESPFCNGPYFGCFGAMNYRIGQSCTDAQSLPLNNGLTPYHPFTMLRQGFLHPDTIRVTTLGVELGDVRLYKDDAIFIPLDEYDGQGLLITNHQLTQYDTILGERGLAVWHWASHQTAPNCGDQENWVLDLEHPGGKWEAVEPGEFEVEDGYCPADPPSADPNAGVDALDCNREGATGALWAGTAWTPGQYRSIDRWTNPNTNRYPDAIAHRLSAQVDTSGVAIRNIQAIADGMHPGKYEMRFDVIVDYPW